MFWLCPSARHYTTRLLLPLLTAVLLPAVTFAQVELPEAQTLLRTGKYEKCLEVAKAKIADNGPEEWWLLAIDASLQLGQYEYARDLLDQGLRKYYRSCQLRQVGYDVYRQLGELRKANQMLEEVNNLVSNWSWRYTDPENLVSLGKVALALGADPRTVLEQFYDRARKDDPNCRAAYLASGQLALDKHDGQVAATTFAAGLEKFPNDADLHFGLAQAYESSDAKKSEEQLKAALDQNPRHVGAMLFYADFLIDSEQYEQAETVLAQLLSINSRHPQAWAYRAVLAHLRGDIPHERAARAAALQTWTSNPHVDHLLGKKLSQKYRFAEGANFQQQALSFDPDFLPAKMQLSQDLLRLGKEEEGWKLADEVHRKDQYDVVTYNLMQLHDRISKFRTLQDKDIILRMDAQEAKVYGNRALRLLQKARDQLGQKYGFTLNEPVTVEIFPKQSDFAVRTFGIPGGSGYLGVCFGQVITANSPASQRANPANWESVLWHEYCHVVTLQLTRNKMPRWLSEGISVYEERQANPAWGQRMNPQYREMILKGDLTPVGNLSAAFLNPPSGQHLQFAYFESSMVVEFLIERFGFECIPAILRDLGAGMPINAALERHTGRPIAALENEFEEFAKQAALALAPDMDWKKPKEDEQRQMTPEKLQQWLADHPQSYFGLLRFAQLLISQEKWVEAKVPLEKLIELYPEDVGADSPYLLLANVHQKLGETEAEYTVLEKLARIDDSAVSAYVRLMELDAKAERWEKVREHAERLLAVDPLRRDVQWHYARACEELAQESEAIEGYQALIALEPIDPAEVHYRLARLLQSSDKMAAKRQVLMALETAPRYPQAQRLLLSLVDENVPEAKSEDTKSDKRSQ